MAAWAGMIQWIGVNGHRAPDLMMALRIFLLKMLAELTSAGLPNGTDHLPRDA